MRILRSSARGETGRLTVDVADSAGATSPISTADVKAWAKIDTSADDTLIGELIDEVIADIETQYGFPIKNKDITATWDSFGAEVRLPYYPVSSITTVKTIDNEGTETTLTENEDYFRRGDSLYFNEVFSSENPFERKALEVVYVAGYENVPNNLILGLKKAILSNYNDREDFAGGMSVSELPNSSRKFFKREMRY